MVVEGGTMVMSRCEVSGIGGIGNAGELCASFAEDMGTCTDAVGITEGVVLLGRDIVG